MIVDADLPVVALIRTLDDPQQGWVHLFGTRRCNTLKNRYKSWRPFAVWLELHFGRKFPVQLKDIIDYIQHRVDEGCGKTIPESFHTSLTLIEQLGRVPEGERLSDEQLWLAHIKAWTAELAADSPPVKPAEMFTIAMLLSLELVVADVSQRLFSRALAWVVLVMIWGSMRCDDVQSTLPHRTTLSNYGLRMVLGKSKTSGPDKIQKEVSVHVYRTVSLTGEDWLGIGYRLWDDEPFNYRRDFLVMEPTADWTSAKRKFVTPSGLSSLISKLLSNLPVPRKQGDMWVANTGGLLLPDGLETHFTGHSPRNFLTSVAAAIGFHKDQRAYLGRWAMGMVASEEYVRTSRQVVFTIQKAVNRSIVTGLDQEYLCSSLSGKFCLGEHSPLWRSCQMIGSKLVRTKRMSLRWLRTSWIRKPEMRLRRKSSQSSLSPSRGAQHVAGCTSLDVLSSRPTALKSVCWTKLPMKILTQSAEHARGRC